MVLACVNKYASNVWHRMLMLPQSLGLVLLSLLTIASIVFLKEQLLSQIIAYVHLLQLLVSNVFIQVNFTHPRVLICNSDSIRHQRDRVVIVDHWDAHIDLISIDFLVVVELLEARHAYVPSEHIDERVIVFH